MGYTPDPRTGKPNVDHSAQETPETMQAIADFAEQVGHLRVGSTQDRNLYEASPGDYWDDRTDGRLYRWHVTRGWQLIGGSVPYVKAVQAADGPIPANRVTGVLSVAIPNAPAGYYWWSFTIVLSSTVASKGEFRIATPATVIHGPLGFDLAANTRTNACPSGTFGHSGGDLLLEFSYFSTAASIVSQGSIAAIHYIRPLD